MDAEVLVGESPRRSCDNALASPPDRGLAQRQRQVVCLLLYYLPTKTTGYDTHIKQHKTLDHDTGDNSCAAPHRPWNKDPLIDMLPPCEK
jgi:hypothetical protein